jgi:hypothetical protein
MRHRPTAVVAVLLSVVALAATPAVVVDAAGASTTAASTTPLDTNLLENAGFNMTPLSVSPVPRWATTGDVHAETFGTRAFPYPAYGRKYHGGARYLSCYGGRGGKVTQTIPVVGRSQRDYKLRARISVSLGGVFGHRVRVSLRPVGSGVPAFAAKTRVLEITDHYKKATTAVTLPVGTTRVVATIELLPKVGSKSCKVMADSADAFLYRDGLLGGH